ncbi:MAG: 30S ribosomal protein S16 [Anaerolineae bacterium]|nr:30S ribosomal protein S16 [Anaerolineae bacterium]
MVRIRLRRVGKIRQASYRVVVADSESPRDGKFIEEIGFYNPRQDPPTVEIQADRALYWLALGAQPSDAVARILRQTGVMAQFEALKAKPAQETVEEAKAPALEEVAAAEAESDAEQDVA